MNRDSVDCVVMFSGGRDSTLAAVRLHSQAKRVALVTVSSDHLVGIDRVRQRLLELRSILPESTPWIHIISPHSLSERRDLEAFTCLPCHRFYTQAGVLMADDLGAKILAFGYSGYQSWWPEQTPYAVHRLSEELREIDLDLATPVYAVDSKDAAGRELEALNLSPEALEQKCLLAKATAPLLGVDIIRSVDVSMALLGSTLRGRHQRDISIKSRLTLGSLS